MKAMFFALVTAISAFAYAEEVKYATISGVFVQDADCVETGYALNIADGSKICLGFHSDNPTEEDLLVGHHYDLAGYFSEDGFFVTEISD